MGRLRRRVLGLARLAAGAITVVAAIVYVVLSFEAIREPWSGRPTGSAEVSTPYLREVAEALARDRVYIDPLLAAERGAPQPRDLLAGSSEDLHVALVPLDVSDGNVGHPVLTARRLQHLLDRPGLFVVLEPGSRDSVSLGCGAWRAGPEGNGYYPCPKRAPLMGAAELAEMDRATSEEQQLPLRLLALLWASLAGIGIGIVVNQGIRLAGWIRSRPVAYLPPLRLPGRRKR